MRKRHDALSALSFFLLLLLFGLAAGGELLLAAALAAALHEIGHIGVLRLFSATEGRLCIHPSGLEWRREEKRMLSYGEELLSVLAGPAMNVLWAAAIARLAAGETGYLFAGAQLMLGLFNLLPVLPLDGGRALELLLSLCFDPLFAWRVLRVLSLLVSVVFLLFSLVLLLSGGTAFLFFTALMLLFLVLQELGLVKRRENG